jgi:hypothetical protein
VKKSKPELENPAQTKRSLEQDQALALNVLKRLSSGPAAQQDLGTAFGTKGTSIENICRQLVAQGFVIEDPATPASTFLRLMRAEDILNKQLVPMPAEAGRKEEVRWVLDLPRAHASCMRQIIELTVRLGIAQLRELTHLIRCDEITHPVGAIALKDVDHIETLVDDLQYALTGFGRGASFGIYSPAIHPDVRRAWYINKLVRHRLAWDATPTGGHGVDHDEPMSFEADLSERPHVHVYNSSTDEEGAKSEPAAANEKDRIFIVMNASDANCLGRMLTFGSRIYRGDQAHERKATERRSTGPCRVAGEQD